MIYKSSEDWYREISDFCEVIDPDGWDRKNFEDSWDEIISKQEFNKRLMRSTIKLKHSERLDSWMKDIPPSLPAPRFEFNWRKIDDYNFECDYSLVIPLGKYDVRREKNDEMYYEEDERKVTINTTTINTGAEDYPYFGGDLDTPFRDGAHVQWDKKNMNVDYPIYIVYGNDYKLFKEVIW